MDSARSTITGEIISGIDTWKMNSNEIDPHSFECLYCSKPVYLASFNKEINKRVPHFKMKKNVQHDEFCPIKKSFLFTKAKTRSICNKDGFPLSYPNKLNLETLRHLVSNLRIQPTIPTSKDSLSQSFPIKQRHNYTVKTIRPLAVQFFNFPFDRHLKLSVPIVEGNSYKDIFKYLSSNIFNYPIPKIFFGSLNLKKTNQFENFFEITLSQGEWNNNKPVEYFRVRVNTQNWNQLEKESVIDEIDIARDQYRKIYEFLKNNPEDKNEIKAWLFFLGEQDNENPYLFHVEKASFICCFCGTYISGYSKNKNLYQKTPMKNQSQLDYSQNKYG